MATLGSAAIVPGYDYQPPVEHGVLGLNEGGEWEWQEAVLSGDCYVTTWQQDLVGKLAKARDASGEQSAVVILSPGVPAPCTPVPEAGGLEGLVLGLVFLMRAHRRRARRADRT